MIGYVTLGTNDLPRATAFYDALFESIGAGRFMEEENYFVAWATSPDQPSIAVSVPFDKEAATVGNGTMIGILMESTSKFKHSITKRSNSVAHVRVSLGSGRKTQAAVFMLATFAI